MDKKIVVWQPVYFPKLHYLSRLNEADVFVIFDDAEFSRQSVQHRAQIDFGGRTWITIPIKQTGDKIPLREAEIDMGQYWWKTHLKTIQAKYGGQAPKPFEKFYDRLGDDPALIDMTIPTLNELLDIFDIDVETYKSSELSASYDKGEPSEYLAEVTSDFDCETYLCGKNAHNNYLDTAPFEKRNINIEVQDWDPTWHGGNALSLDVVYEADNPARYI